MTAGQINNPLITIPPGCTKSRTVGVFGPSWTWLRWPESRWLLFANADELATREGMACRRLLESEWYRFHYPDAARITTDQNTKNRMAARLPTHVTLKDVKKRWGHGHEDVYPVCQFEKLWGDMTVVPGVDCGFVVVPRVRGQQLKDPAQLDGWLRDGSAAFVEGLCRFA